MVISFEKMKMTVCYEMCVGDGVQYRCNSLSS